MADEEVVVTLPEDLSQPLVDQEFHIQSEADKTAAVKKVDAEGDDDPVADLKGQLDTIQRSATTLTSQLAEQTTRADQAERERDAARHDVIDGQYDTIVSGINAAKAEADAAELALTDAHERGDMKAVARAQRMLAQAEAKVVPLEMAKGELEAARKARPEKREAKQPDRLAPPGDPVEAYLSSRTPASQAWLRQHRDMVTANGPAPKLVAAHWDAVSNNLQADTPEYFAHIEQKLGFTQVSKRSDKQQDQAAPQRRPSAPSVPVTTSGGGLNGGKAEVRLTAGEVRSATDGTLVWNYDDSSPRKLFKKGDPIGVQEMARRKAVMTAEGQYDKTLTQ
jgi:hypothetical protein